MISEVIQAEVQRRLGKGGVLAPLFLFRFELSCVRFFPVTHSAGPGKHKNIPSCHSSPEPWRSSVHPKQRLIYLK